MRVYFYDKKLVIIIGSKDRIYFNLTYKVDNSLEDEIDSIIKHNTFLVE